MRASLCVFAILAVLLAASVQATEVRTEADEVLDVAATNSRSLRAVPVCPKYYFYSLTLKKCQKCQAGFVATPSRTGCVKQCGKGFQLSTTLPKKCVACSYHSYDKVAATGQNTCIMCPSGYKGDATRTKCIPYVEGG